MSSEIQSWSVGDSVRNPARPEWGAGTVLRVLAHRHEGQPCQQVFVRFDRAGRKTVLTALAALERVDESAGDAGRPEGGEVEPSTRAGAAPELSARALGDPPDGAVGRSIPPSDRLGEALAWFRFEPGDRVLEWAIQRSGQRDPLSRYSRNELEAEHARFMEGLRGSLRTLVMDTLKQGPEHLQRVISSAPPEGRAAAQRAMTPRTGSR